MAKMDDETLLSFLQGEEELAGDYVWGKLADERETAMREYQRLPYGDEEEGRSSFVTSDVLDTIEWVRPALLKIFVGGDQAVTFEPTGPEDVDAAQQATDGCNYVFFKQNNGFLIMYTAITDALMLKNACVHWSWKEFEQTETQRLQNISDMELTMLMEQLKAEKLKPEISESADPIPATDEMGMPVIGLDGEPVMVYPSVRLKTTKKTGKVFVEAFPPEELLVKRDWTSPMLGDCPYVCRMMRVTLSELREMGFDVDADDLAAADRIETSADRTLRESEAEDWTNRGQTINSEDETRNEGWLRLEFVMVDYDGDGISERRMIARLHDRILSNEPCSHVPIATASPILKSHRWDGFSLAELVSDLQRLNTVITRGVLDSLYLSLNARKKVLTDAAGAPMADIDDLLDSRVGGIIRVRTADAVQEEVTPFVGQQALPMLEYVDRARMNRSGVNYLSSGLDANSINKTAQGARITDSRMQERTELIARVIAECLVSPMFAGILKLLTEYQMEPLSFRLRNKFVQYDPQEWRDQYDMTINVGLGTGSKDTQALALGQIEAAQLAAVQSGGMGLLVTPKNIYNLQAEKIKLAGFQNVDDFWTDPGDKMPQQQQGPSPEQVKAEADLKKQQTELQADAQKFQAQAQIDQGEAERQRMFDAEQKALDRENDYRKAQLDASVRLQIAEMSRQTAIENAERKAKEADDPTGPKD